MPSKTLIADRSSLLARNNAGGVNLGGGQDQHLPIINNPGGYNLRGLIGFTFPAGFWDDIRKINTVFLRVAGTNGTAHVAKGAAAKAYVYRVIAGWSGNSAGESWSTSPVVYGGPAVTSAGGVVGAMPTGYANGFIDITAIALAWAPNTTLGPSGAPGGGAVCYGVSVQETGGAADAAEIYSAVWGVSTERPALVFDYISNAPPDAPTIIRPVGADQPAGTFEAQGHDPEGDAHTAYDLEVSTDPTFATVTHWQALNQTAGLSAAGALSRAYGGTPMTTGARYYWRCRMRDAGGWGAWSSVATFVKAAGGAGSDMYDAWAQAILADMAFGRTALKVGTLRPIDAQVAQLICSEYGDLLRVKWDETSPPLDEQVYLLGERVTLDPNGWSVDAIVELKREVGS
jgi:hypothetical protein